MGKIRVGQIDDIFNQIQDAIFAFDKEWKFIYVNSKAEIILRKSRENLLYHILWDEYPHLIGTEYEVHYVKAMNLQQVIEFESFTQNRYLAFRIVPISQGLIVFVRDINNQKEDLFIEEKKLEMSQHVANLYFWEWDLLKNSILWSPSAYQIFGLDPEKDVPTYDKFIMMIHPEDRERLEEIIKHSFSTGGYTTEYRIIRPDGSTRHLRSEARVIFNEKGDSTRIFGTAHDITEKKLSEEYVRNVEKLSIVGELAAGIAHEIRNPLTSLFGFLKLLEEKATDKEKKYIHIMKQELSRLDFYSGELLVLSKPHSIQIAENSIQNILKYVVTLLETQSILHNIQIQMKCDENSVHILCDENQMKQMFVNLMKNAIEAMPYGGEIFIEYFKTKNNQVCIMVKDEGEGMPQHIINKLGFPFLTTKDKGTGLGLMITKKIIEDHHGRIVFESEEGKGTIVKVYFPISK